MKQFWVGRGLKPNRARWLLKEAEEQPKLRCPDLLQQTLSKLSVVGTREISMNMLGEISLMITVYAFGFRRSLRVWTSTSCAPASPHCCCWIHESCRRG